MNAAIGSRLAKAADMPARCLLYSLAFLLICVPPAIAATPEEDAAVLAGYRQYYNGDLPGAQRAFETLIGARASNLAAHFGWLRVMEARSADDRTLEPEFERRLDLLLDDAEGRVGRSSTDDEALFYLAAGYLLRANFRVERDKGMWGAARDGARAKRLSEQYLQRHPEHGDAYFVLGMYNYYVELMPSFYKALRLFLFLPSGDRALGLQQIERAYSQGSLFAPQAGLSLMEIYGEFESRPADGIGIGERLTTQYPDNPKMQFSLAELYESPAVESFDRAAATYERIVASEDHRPGAPRAARYQARLGLASALLSQWRSSESIAVLDAAIAQKPEQPLWVMPNLLLRRANYRALSNDPGADADVEAVLAEPKWKEWHVRAAGLQQWITQRRTSGEATIYAALMPGNRFCVAREWDQAAAAYEEVRRRYPSDPQVRFRLAYVAFRRGDYAHALPEMASLADSKSTPEWLRAQATLYAARAQDLSGRRPDAMKLYQRVVDRYDQESAAWAAKVGLVSPYRRPLSVQQR
jgi:tetratricopeptide (TPR) repeat protein